MTAEAEILSNSKSAFSFDCARSPRSTASPRVLIIPARASPPPRNPLLAAGSTHEPLVVEIPAVQCTDAGQRRWRVGGDVCSNSFVQTVWLLDESVIHARGLLGMCIRKGDVVPRRAPHQSAVSLFAFPSRLQFLLPRSFLLVELLQDTKAGLGRK